ncbi:MAG: mucoidy inhibitor MuiA family protein [Pseudomonadota bacterium]
MGRLSPLLPPLLLLPALVNADELRPNSSTVDSVTVFLDRAEVTRRVEVDLRAGAHTVLVSGLPAQLNETSLRASGKGPAGLSIATVETRRRFGEEAAGEQERELREQLQALNDEKDLLLGRRQALDTRAKFIEQLADLPSEKDENGNRVFAPEKWATAWEAIGQGMTEVNTARADLKRQQRTLDAKIQKIEQQLRQIQTGRRDTLTAAIQVEAKQSGKASFELSYQLGSASWSPVYDAALDTEKGEMLLTQAAYIRQSSGETWDNARVSVSTTRPSSGSAMPTLHPWWIDFAQPKLLRESRQKMQADEALAGAIAPRSAAPQKEAEVSQAQSVGTDFSVRYAIPGRVTVPADNSRHRFVLSRESHPVTLLARTAPRLDERAFLYAELDYQGDGPLLPGPWQLQRDNTFVGTHHNEALRPGETIALAFGGDEAIEVEHQLLKDERAEEGIINREERVQRRYRLTLTNHHQRKLPISVFDQLPVSRDERIQVEMAKDSNRPNQRDVNDRSGVLEWKRSLAPGEKWTIHFGYNVSYPQDKEVPGF